MLEINKAFKNGLTVYVINEKRQSKCIFFNEPAAVEKELADGGKVVTSQEWDRFKTKSQRK